MAHYTIQTQTPLAGRLLGAVRNAKAAKDEDLDIVEDGDTSVISSISTSWSMDAVNSRVPADPIVSDIVKRYRRETEGRSMISSFGEEIASSLGIDDVVATIGDGGGRGGSSSSRSVGAGTSTCTSRTRSCPRRRRRT